MLACSYMADHYGSSPRTISLGSGLSHVANHSIHSSDTVRLARGCPLQAYQTLPQGTQWACCQIDDWRAQPDVAAIIATATPATVLRIPSVTIFAIFRKRALLVTFIGASFAKASCWS